MKDIVDIVRVLRGSKHCPWCIDIAPSWADRLLQRDRFVSERTIHDWVHRADRIYCNIVYKANIWRIGSFLHRNLHERP